MENYLSGMSGSYSKKVTDLLHFHFEQLKNIHPDNDSCCHCQTDKDVALHYDYSPLAQKKRRDTTIKYEKEAQEHLAGTGSKEEISGAFAFANFLIMCGGYNSIDSAHDLSLAAAVWILDQLSLQGDLEQIYKYLPAVEDDDDFICHYVFHPEYDSNTIIALTKLLTYRNYPDYKGLKPLHGTIFFEGKQNTTINYQNRKNTDAILTLLDENAIKKAIKSYENYVWDFYRLSFEIIARLEDEKSKIKKELKSINGTEKVPAIPLAVYNSSSYSSILEGLQQSAENIHPELSSKKTILTQKLNKLESTPFFSCISMVDEREKLIREFDKTIGTELSNALINFSVDDPFEMAFALFYLLDSGSNIPWLYYGSISVAYTLMDQLPFDVPASNPREAESSHKKTNQLNYTLYHSLYKGSRWKCDTNNQERPIPRSHGKNLSQIIYSNTSALFPRVTHSISDTDRISDDLNIHDNQEQSFAELLFYLFNSLQSHNYNLQAFQLLQKIEAEDNSNSQLQEKAADNPDLLKAELAEYRKEIVNLKQALHNETKLRQIAQQNLKTIDVELSQSRLELADLRNIVFNKESSAEKVEEPSEIVFPQFIGGRIVSFGGHPSWIHEMKKLLPNIQFYSPELSPNPDVIRGAEEIWIQTNCISHSAYYRIISNLKGYNVQMRYFKFSGARKCAEQFINESKAQKQLL